MEVVVIMRVLWRFRLLMAVAGLLAVLAGVATVYRIGVPPKLESRQYTVGVGAASALVDTPSSQTVDLGDETGANIATLAARATLLASVMTSSPIKDEIAKRAGVAPDKLLVGDAATGGASGGASAVAGRDAVTLQATVPVVDSGEVPIIAVRTQAPTAAQARRVADAAFEELKLQLASVAGIDKVPDARRLTVRRLGTASAATLQQGPGMVLGLVIGLVAFLVGCTLIVGLWALVSGWRRAAELDSEEELAEAGETWPYGDGAPVVAFDDHKPALAIADDERAEAQPRTVPDRPGVGARP
jgi:hypothetical protein